MSGSGSGLGDEPRMDDEVDTVRYATMMPLFTDDQIDGLMSKLAIERRVQYGAEKMLDVRLGTLGPLLSQCAMARTYPR